MWHKETESLAPTILLQNTHTYHRQKLMFIPDTDHEKVAQLPWTVATAA